MIRVFLCLLPVDIRRSFDGLAEQVVRQDPLSGHLFVFRGRCANSTTGGVRSPIRGAAGRALR